MNFRLASICFLICFLVGCGGGTSSSGGTTLSLTTSNAQSKAAVTNQTVNSLVQTSIGFVGTKPVSASRQVARQSTVSQSNMVVGFNQGVYTISDGDNSTYDYTIQLTYLDADNQIITSDDLLSTQQMKVVFDGYEYVNGIKYTYNRLTLQMDVSEYPNISTTGSGSAQSSDGAGFSITIGNLNVSAENLEVTGGEIKIEGKDGSNKVVASSSFKNDGTLTLQVQKDESVVVDKQADSLPIASGNLSQKFKANSGFITNPCYGDMVKPVSKRYNGQLKVGSLSYNFDYSLAKSPTIHKRCGINALKYTWGLPLPSQQVRLIDQFIAQDKDGNVWDLGDSEQAPDCTNLSMLMINNPKAGDTWDIRSYEDNSSMSAVIVATGVTHNGFDELVRVRTSENDGTVHEEYYSSFFGLVYGSSSNGEDLIEMNRVKSSVAHPIPPQTLVLKPKDNAMLVTWPPVNGAARYYIYYSTDKNFSKSNATKIGPLRAYRKIKGLRNGEKYYFAVTSENYLGESILSSKFKGVPVSSQKALNPPSDLRVVSTNQSLTVTWSLIPNAASYRLCYSTQEFSNPANASCINNVFPPKKLEHLVNQQNYWIRVGSENNTLSSTLSSLVTGMPTVSYNEAPLKPEIITENFSNGRLDMAWNPVSNANSYEVLLGGSFAGSWYQTRPIESTALTTYVTYLSQEGAYTFSVRGINDTGPGIVSKRVNVYVSKYMNQPDPEVVVPENLRVSLYDWKTSSVQVTWNSTSRLYYTLRYKKKSDSYWVTRYRGPGGSVQVSGLLHNQEYEFSVNSSFSGTSSEFCAPVTFTIDGQPLLPTAPTFISTGVLNDKVILEWTAAQNAEKHFAYFHPTDASVASGYSETMTTSPFRSSMMYLGRCYYIKLYATNSFGSGPFSEIKHICVKSDATSVEAPDIQVTYGDVRDSLMVKWSPGKNNTSYRIYWNDSAFSSETNNVKYAYGSSTGSQYFYNFEAGKAVYFRMKGNHYQYGDSAFSDMVMITPSYPIDTRPQTPTGVSTGVRIGDSVEVTWNSSKGAEEYDIYYTASNGGTPQWFNSTGRDSAIKVENVSSPFRFENMSGARTILFVVVARNQYGESPWPDYLSTVF
jgi:hypothetical protein